jgi:hypothetical protein
VPASRPSAASKQRLRMLTAKLAAMVLIVVVRHDWTRPAIERLA